MKYGLAITTSLVSAGALFLACSAEDPAPPPVAGLAGATSTPGAGDPPPVGAAGSAPATTPGTGPTSSGGATSEGQGGAPALQAGAGTGPVGGGDNPAAGGAPAAAGGAPAGGAGGAAPTDLTLQQLVGGLDGHLFVVPCGDTPGSDDCAGAGWTSNFQDPGMNHNCVGTPARLDARIDFPIGGEPGVAYDVDMHFYGIMEPRQYANVTRDAQPNRPSLQPGGAPPFAVLNPGATNYLAGDNNYNTYELRVLNENDQEVAAYFLNADTQDGHYTFNINYGKTIELIGGGTLRLQIVDANCRQIKNCGGGSNGGANCANQAQTVDISGAAPQPPANALQQPALGVSPAHAGQWFLLDVLDFATAE